MSQVIATPEAFIGSGKWAAEQFRKHGLKASSLRTNDTLRRDEWKHFDDAVVEEGAIRLRAAADLIARPELIMQVPNALGKTVIEYEQVSDMQAAERSMSGITRSALDTVDFTRVDVPAYITHKDFNVDARRLAASRERGESLDTMKARVAARLVFEGVEYALLNGAGITAGGGTAYGYTNHPSRNTVSFEGTGGTWDSAGKTGIQCLADVATAKAALQGDRFFGPYALYVPGDCDVTLDKDFDSTSANPLTIRERLMKVDGIVSIQVCDQLATNNLLLVQLTPDVVQLASGIEIQTVQWDTVGAFLHNFKVFGIQVPLVKSTHAGRCGVAHMT